MAIEAPRALMILIQILIKLKLLKTEREDIFCNKQNLKTVSVYQGLWIFGVAQANAEGHQVRFSHVHRRDMATSLPIIWKHVYPGTTRWSVEWKVYSPSQATYGYDHQTVNHFECFVDFQTSCHTELIECLWRHAKHKS